VVGEDAAAVTVGLLSAWFPADNDSEPLLNFGDPVGHFVNVMVGEVAAAYPRYGVSVE